MEEITTVGIDLAKEVFAVCVLDAHGAVLERKVLRRAAFERWAATLAPCTVAMEACGSAHHWGRFFAARNAGHGRCGHESSNRDSDGAGPERAEPGRARTGSSRPGANADAEIRRRRWRGGYEWFAKVVPIPINFQRS